MDTRNALRYRIAPLEMTPSEFRKVGRQLVERIAEFLCTLPSRPVVPNESPRVIREALGTGPLPEQGSEAKDLLEEAANLLFAHSTFNGHGRLSCSARVLMMVNLPSIFLLDKNYYLFLLRGQAGASTVG